MATANSRLDQDAAVFGDTRPDRATSSAALITGYAAAIVMIAVATLVAFGLESGTPIPNLSLVYVIPVIAAGVIFGVGPSLCAAVLGALAYNFFFVEPRYSLMVDDSANIWAIALLLIVGVIVSTIAFGARRRAADIAVLTREVGVLQVYGRDVTAARDREAIMTTTSQALLSVFQVPSLVITIKNGEIESFKSAGGLQPEPSDFAAAKLALELGAASRAKTYPSQDARFDFWPVPNVGHPTVIGLAFGSENRPAAQDELVDILRSTLALALDRAELRQTNDSTNVARN